jgi:hypothetical protein
MPNLNINTELLVAQSGIMGAYPSVWMNTVAINGDANPFMRAPAGSLYAKLDKTNHLIQWYVKRSMGNVDSDWGVLGGVGVVQQHVSYDEFTDGGGAAGTLVLAQSIPAGAQVLRSNVRDLIGFTGDTSATILIGDGTDADRYSTGTPSVFTTAAILDVGAVSGTAWHSVAKSVTLTVTSNANWGDVAAGSMTVQIYYVGA